MVEVNSSSKSSFVWKVSTSEKLSRNLYIHIFYKTFHACQNVGHGTQWSRDTWFKTFFLLLFSLRRSHLSLTTCSGAARCVFTWKGLHSEILFEYTHDHTYQTNAVRRELLAKTVHCGCNNSLISRYQGRGHGISAVFLFILRQQVLCAKVKALELSFCQISFQERCRVDHNTKVFSLFQSYIRLSIIQGKHGRVVVCYIDSLVISLYGFDLIFNYNEGIESIQVKVL